MLEFQRDPFFGTVTIVSAGQIADVAAPTILSTDVDRVASGAVLNSGNTYSVLVRDFNDVRGLKTFQSLVPNLYLWTRPSLPNQDCQTYRIVSVVANPDATRTLVCRNLYQGGFTGSPGVGGGVPVVQYSDKIALPYFVPSASGVFGTVDARIQASMMADAFGKINALTNAKDARVDSLVLEVQRFKDLFDASKCFEDDAAALAGGKAVGDIYLLCQSNPYGHSGFRILR